MIPAFKRVLDNARPVNTANPGKVETRQDFTAAMEDASAVYSAKISEIMGEVDALVVFFAKLLTLGPDDGAAAMDLINALPDNAAVVYADAMEKVSTASAIAEATAIAEAAAINRLPA